MKAIIFIALFFTACICEGQQFSEKISKELSFEKKSTSNALIVGNINGTVKISGYNGDKILVEMDKKISAKTEARLEKGKKVTLGIIDRADTIVLFVDGLCQSFGKNSKRNRNQSGYNYEFNGNCQSCKEEFDYTTTFTIKVPFQTHVSVSTINDGNITVENVKGIVSASNINGSIRLENLEREADATTINGDLDVVYASNPKNPCRFYSLNGDINAFFQQGLAANLSFESFNGNFYTNVERITQLPPTIEQDNSNKQGIRYKLGGNRYQVGAGGSLLDFETFNGNVYLKERAN